LGANSRQFFWRIVLPTILPAALTGFSLALARGIGEYGSVIFIAGNIPYVSEIAPLLVAIRVDEESGYESAAVIAILMMIIAFILLLLGNILQRWTRFYQK
ncbi:MAG TPA: ABC transporter permease subunit, partial [Alphaproteobacteria bacterium]|nr:ABC transporter permease subunit [Alphaproteobacteria bacterium]